MGDKMRLLLATLSHETNTFSPVPTKLERFCRDGTSLLTGQTATDFYHGTGTCMGGYLGVAGEIGAEVVVPVCASAPPSGPVDNEAYETMCRMITDAVAIGGFGVIGAEPRARIENLLAPTRCDSIQPGCARPG
jgi:microcystin degradation protein MlrC